MPFRSIISVLAFVGTFAIAALAGYVSGQAFLAPGSAPSQRVTRLAPPPAARQLQAPRAPLPQTPPSPPPAPAPAPQPQKPPTPTPSPSSQATPAAPGGLYRVQVGAFLRRQNAEARAEELRQRGFEAYINLSSGLYKVRVGAFAERANANQLAEQLHAAGYEVFIIHP